LLCEQCHSNIAKIHMTQTVNGKTAEKHLCESCALETDGKVSPFSFSVHDFTNSLFEESLKHEIGSGSQTRKSCHSCGQSYADYKRTGLFGCPACYESFRLVIMPLVKRIQGNLQHTGKVPVKKERVLRFKRKKTELQGALNEAVRNESFERAAELRDQILLLDKKIFHIEGESS
jgi:protein arginine kinase activator